MKRTGIVDLGSNTARLVVYGYEPGESYRLLDEIREPVRLSDDIDADGRLSKRAMRRAVDAVRLYADYARATDLGTIDVIATSAVRDAGNRKRFLERTADLDLNVRVLSGEEEAELGVLAVANSFAIPDAWVVDLGGGSAQISRMHARATRAGISLPLGAVRMTRAFLPSDPPRTRELTALRKHLANKLKQVVRPMRDDDAPLVGMGGTVRNLARAVQRIESYPVSWLHGYRLSREALDALIEELIDLRTRKRARTPGIHPDRAEMIVAGAIVFSEILRISERDSVCISGQGIREGAFYQQFLPAPHRIDDVRRFGVRNVFHRFPQPDHHTQRVIVLSTTLFDRLQPLHQLEPIDRELLWAAATLHDIGKAVNHYDHQHHGAYLVESAPVLGFSHREQALLSLLVRYHRKGLPKGGDFRPLLQKSDRKRLLHLASCLRLAEKMERSCAGRVKQLDVKIEADQVSIHLDADEPPYVELWEAEKQSTLFEEAFGRRLVLEHRAAAQQP